MAADLIAGVAARAVARVGCIVMLARGALRGPSLNMVASGGMSFCRGMSGADFEGVGLDSPSVDANGKYTFSLMFLRLFEDLPLSGVWPPALGYGSVASDDETAGQETLGQDVWFTLVHMWLCDCSVLVHLWFTVGSRSEPKVNQG